MNVITHALLPALLATPLLPRTNRKEFFRAAGLVALAGALPDLLHPHLSLAARYASWTHSIFTLTGFGLLLLLVHRLAPDRFSWRLAGLAWFAFGLHLFGDAVSGGIAFYQPLSATVIGPHPRWIPYSWWPWCDLVCIAAAIAILIVSGARFDRQDARGSVGRET